jgi:hypothetical protein
MARADKTKLVLERAKGLVGWALFLMAKDISYSFRFPST